MNNKKISIIACMGANNEIGLNGQMPWGNSFKEDLRHFKELTTGNIVIMGRKTWESIGSKPLPNRKNIVVSRDWNYLSKIGCDVACTHSITDAIDMFNDDRELFIIGGSQIYEQYLDLADTLYITKIYKSFKADTFFPKIDTNDLVVSNVETNSNDDFMYSFMKLERKQNERN